MLRSFYLIGLIALSSVASAGEKPKPNTLTQKEIEEGWILLFDGETTFGWKVEGDATIENGNLRLSGVRGEGSSLTSTSAWGLCMLKVECAGTGKLKFGFHVDGVDFKCPGTDRFVTVDYRAQPENRILIATTGEENRPVTIQSGKLPQGIEFGVSPIRFKLEKSEIARFKSIKLRPLGTQSLFNGKDLAGWKVFDDPKRNASKWSVTKEGWLNVRNGPGDLQTEKKFDDFILQFDCISNGKALNSGIFFRCIENQYQNGYEAQIQNGFKDNDRTKPADFGTGAIYRRIAARKVIPNDNEWFTMTVLAHGKHIATWVNGYQTVDWTDDRKENDNPRNGYRAAAGRISIQGHDPTTDLSFRNIRIVELKK